MGKLHHLHSWKEVSSIPYVMDYHMFIFFMSTDLEY